ERIREQRGVAVTLNGSTGSDRRLELPEKDGSGGRFAERGWGWTGKRSGPAAAYQRNHLLPNTLERREPHVGVHRDGQALEDLPVRPGQPERAPDRPKTLAPALPRREVPVAFDEGRRGQHRVGERRETGAVDVLHDPVPAVPPGVGGRPPV